MNKKILFTAGLMALMFAALPFFASASCGGDGFNTYSQYNGCNSGCNSQQFAPSCGNSYANPYSNSYARHHRMPRFMQTSFDNSCAQPDCNNCNSCNDCNNNSQDCGQCDQCDSNRETAPVMGTVSSISAGTLTVKNKDDATYLVDASNAKISKGDKEIALQDIKNGDKVIAKGELNGNNLDAEYIFVYTPQEETPAPSTEQVKIWGNVIAVNGNNFTIKSAKNGQVTTSAINTNSSTVFEKGGQNASVNDVVAGRMASVEGTKDSSGTITASKVHIVLPTPKIKMFKAVVNSISGNTLTVTSNNGIVFTVDASSAKITNQNDSTINLSSVQVNDNVDISGSLPQNATNIQAIKVQDTSR